MLPSSLGGVRIFNDPVIIHPQKFNDESTETDSILISRTYILSNKPFVRIIETNPEMVAVENKES